MLEVKNLVKLYKSKSGVVVKALDDISLKFPKTGMIFILGKSGSGKSTLLNVMGGLDNFDSGDILVKGQSTKEFKQSHFDSFRNTYVGFIFQEYNILDNLTVGQNVALAMQLQNRKPTSQEITSILEEVDLGGLGDRKPNELSGGQKQRVAIARALVKNPDIIMGDEPTGALDSNTGIQIFNTLKKLSKDKLVIIVSHDREFSEKYADRIIELKDGKIISDVTNTTKGVKVEEANITFTGNEIIVKKDYQLTTNDLKIVNEYLKSLKKGAKIVKGNNEKQSATKSKFINTNQDTIKLETGGFKLIKSRLPLKRAIQIGASALQYKKVKLGFTIFLSLIAFTMLGSSITLALTDETTAAANALSDSTYEELAIEKYQYTISSDFGGAGVRTTSECMPLKDDEVNTINEQLDNKAIKEYRYYQDSSTSYSYNGVSINECEGSTYYLNNVTRFAQQDADQNIITKAGYTFISSDPQSASNANSIYISQYIFNSLQKGKKTLKYKDDTKTLVMNENVNEEQVLGYKINLSGVEAIIAGVFSTGFNINDERYSELFDESIKTKDKSEALINEVNNAQKRSLDCCIVGANNQFLNWLETNVIKEHTRAITTLAVKHNFRSNLSTRILLNKLSKKTDIGNNQFTKYFVNNYMIEKLESKFASLLPPLRKIFLYIGLIFVAFSGLLLANFIANSISYQKKEIGILRAIGARGVDVFKIYVSEAFIIAAVNFVLSTITSLIVVQFAISPKLTSITGGATVFKFNILAILILLGVSFLAAFISTYVPVLLTARKRPVEAIRNK